MVGFFFPSKSHHLSECTKFLHCPSVVLSLNVVSVLALKTLKNILSPIESCFLGSRSPCTTKCYSHDDWNELWLVHADIILLALNTQQRGGITSIF